MRTRVAVDHLSLGIKRGERFGLLGVNGAGKSTTLKVLCGDHPPTAGSVTVCGLSVTGDLSKVQRVIGYCPQFDPLLELMTGRETARMYAMLKGVPARDADAAADAVLRSVGLRKFADRPCGTFSGGNKRKLSLAVALVGGPRVLLLDEPSSGMCPLGRRMMWDTVERAASGLTLLLTTHAMDECEALCERVGMMAGGKLRCLGSSQHLKSRFGEGYVVDAKVASASDGSGEEGARKAAAVRSAVESGVLPRLLELLREVVQRPADVGGDARHVLQPGEQHALSRPRAHHRGPVRRLDRRGVVLADAADRPRGRVLDVAHIAHVALPGALLRGG